MGAFLNRPPHNLLPGSWSHTTPPHPSHQERTATKVGLLRWLFGGCSTTDEPVRTVPFTLCSHYRTRHSSLRVPMYQHRRLRTMMQSRPLACRRLSLSRSLHPQAVNHAYPDRTSWYRRHHRRQGKPMKHVREVAPSPAFPTGSCAYVVSLGACLRASDLRNAVVLSLSLSSLSVQ